MALHWVFKYLNAPQRTVTDPLLRLPHLNDFMRSFIVCLHFDLDKTGPIFHGKIDMPKK